MRRFENFKRAQRLMESAIADFELDLRGITVLTEAASGPFVVTPVIAALAGADRVFAVGRDSRFGAFTEIKAYTESWGASFGITDRLLVTDRSALEFAADAQLVTNLGFLRPLNQTFIARLGPEAAISLMWEPWEYRPEDLDLAACYRYGVPVLGTCETHPRLQIFRYVGLIALKLLLVAEIEVFKARIVVIGSGHFGAETCQVLAVNGADIFPLDPTMQAEFQDDLQALITEADAVVIVEHNLKRQLLGGDSGIQLEWLVQGGVQVIHICGTLDDRELATHGVVKLPHHKGTPGFMSVTTDYVGPRPVIDLHTAGLKVGESLVHGKRTTSTITGAISYALKNSPALNFSPEQLATLIGDT